MTLSCTCLAEDFERRARDRHGRRAGGRPSRTRNWPSAAPKRSPRCVRTKTIPPSARSRRLSELLYGAGIPTAGAPKGPSRRSSAIDRVRSPAFTRRYVRPVGALARRRGGRRSARVRSIAPAAELEGWTGAACESDQSFRPPAARRSAACAMIAMPGKVADRHRVRVHHHQPARSALLRVLDDEQHPRPVRPRRPAGRQHPRTPGDGVLRVQLVRSDRRARARSWFVPASIRRTSTARSRPLTRKCGSSANEGPTALEVDETRAYLIGSIPRLLETNYSIASFLQSCEQFGLGLDYDRRLPALLEAVTIDEIRSRRGGGAVPRARRRRDRRPGARRPEPER